MIKVTFYRDGEYVYINNPDGTTKRMTIADFESMLNGSDEYVRIDPTLTQSGQAADAKVTGDEISDLKSAFEYSVHNGAFLYSVTKNGSFKKDGLTTGSANRIRTDIIPFESGDVISIKNDGLPHACGMWEGTVSSDTIRRNDDNFNASDEAIECGYSGYAVVVFKRSDNSNLSPSDFTGTVSNVTAKTYLRPLYDVLEQKIDKESKNLVSTHLGELCPVEGVTTGTYLTMSTSDGEPIGLNPGQTNISFYDSNKNFIDKFGFTQTNSVRTIRLLSSTFADVKYVAITNNEPRIPIMLNVGSVALPYQPYYSNISTITDEIYNLKNSAPGEEIIQKESYAVVDSLTHHVTGNGQPSRVALSVLWATDIHAEVERTRRMIEITNTWNNFDIVINTGDTTSTLYSDGVAWYDNIVKDSNVPILNTVGNHDAWTDLHGALAPRIDVYNMIVAPVAEQTEIVQPEKASVNGLCYYYKDVNGIRIIVLDCMYWDADELTWFVNTLNSTTLPVIACVHYPFSANARTLADSIWNTEIPNVSASVVPLTAAEAVQTFMASGGTFICWLQGHSHADRIGVLTGYGNQLCLQATSFTNRETLVYKGTNTAEYNYDALTAITIDTTDKTLKMYRIGANINGAGQKYNLFAYNYQTKNVICDW